MQRFPIRAAAISLTLLVWTAPPLRAQLPASEAAAGVFLVAKPQIPDPRFRETVILLVSHDREGTAGLILNRPADLRLPNTPDAPPLYRGGPVAPAQILALGRGNPPDASAQPVWEDVWWTTDPTTVLGLFEEGDLPPSSVRLFLGYSGWGPDQLDRELALGDGWALFHGAPDDAFDPDPEGLWQRFTGPASPLLVWHPDRLN